ncbi:MAG: hypothetical protein ACUVWR_11895 [Anaerolineae bacterium]
MDDKGKSKAQLLAELAELRQRLSQCQRVEFVGAIAKPYEMEALDTAVQTAMRLGGKHV